MNGFVISEGTAIRLADIIAVGLDENKKPVAILDIGLQMEISNSMYRKIMAAIWNSRERSF